jgi:hypothetical protein
MLRSTVETVKTLYKRRFTKVSLNQKHLVEKETANECVSIVGTLPRTTFANIVEILGPAGFDSVVFGVPGPIGLKDAKELIRASGSTQISPVVLVP